MSNNDNRTITVPDPEVRPKAKRRQFTTEYKKRILDEAKACSTAAQRGALVRREGLYSSHLNAWRRQRAQGILDGLAPKKRGAKSDPLSAEIARLQLEIERLQAQLQRAETIIDIQKKISQLLGLPTTVTPPDETA
jgi:transposase-like protein